MSTAVVPILEPVPQPLPTPHTLRPGQGRPIVVCNDDIFTNMSRQPFVFVSAFLAGLAARAMMLPFHPLIGNVNPAFSVVNRGFLFGIAMGLWIPHNMAMQEPNLIAWKRVRRMFKYAFFAGVASRIAYNPVMNAQATIVKLGVRPGIQEMKGWFPFLKKKGLVNWWENQPTIMGNALYFTFQVILFEAARNYIVRRFDIDTKDATQHATVCTAAGGLATFTAASITWRINKGQYTSNLLRTTVFSKGYLMTMFKEVPMGAVSFGAYSWLMAQLSPATPNAGFGF